MSLFNAIAVCVLSVLYSWMFYNIPILVAGARNLPVNIWKQRNREVMDNQLPSISIIVPAENEAAVICRLLEALLRLDYPRKKLEVIIVDGASTDGTPDLSAQYVRRFPSLVKLVRQPIADGKPGALNLALGHVHGQIVCIFDADSLPRPDVLMRAVEYFWASRLRQYKAERIL